jgi:Zn-dependent M28 family amino/carboxypeptidase
MPLTDDLTDLAARLRRHVETLARTPRTPTTPEHRAAADYIRAGLERAGFVVREARTVADKVMPCVNLLTDPLPARPDLPLFVVGAHYDSATETPGADDNASAVAALLELAVRVRPLLDAATGCRLQLAAYDLEEYGMIGSLIHAGELKRAGERVHGMISLEMLGYTDSRPGSQQLPAMVRHLYPDVGDFIGVCGTDDGLALIQAVAEGLKTVPGLPVQCLAVPERGMAIMDVRLSDHSSFWDAGFPALMVTDTSFYRNPHYHKPSDTPDTLDYPFLAKVTAGLAAAVGRIVAGPRGGAG